MPDPKDNTGVSRGSQPSRLEEETRRQEVAGDDGLLGGLISFPHRSGGGGGGDLGRMARRDWSWNWTESSVSVPSWVERHESQISVACTILSLTDGTLGMFVVVVIVVVVVVEVFGEAVNQLVGHHDIVALQELCHDETDADDCVVLGVLEHHGETHFAVSKTECKSIDSIMNLAEITGLSERKLEHGSFYHGLQMAG